MLTVDQGYDLSRKQRPGVIITMGPEAAAERWMKPLRYSDLAVLPGPNTWLEYDLGFRVSPWAMWAALCFARVSGRSATHDEYKWLMAPQTGISDVREWIANATEPEAL